MQIGKLLMPLSALGKHRSLTYELAKRDVLGRYRGASFGLLWSLFTPFLLLLVYTLAFGYVFKSRWPGAGDRVTDFAVILFVGLIVHGFFAECMTRAPNVIVGQPNFVKRIVFPLEVLSWVTVSSALFHTAMNVLVLLALNIVLRGEFHITSLLLPLVMAPLVILAVGVGWAFSAVGVFLRDIGQATGVVATAMLFLSSAIVPVHTLPENYQQVFRANPLTFIIDQSREVMIWGRLPDWSGLATYALVASMIALLAFLLFGKLRAEFADVL